MTSRRNFLALFGLVFLLSPVRAQQFNDTWESLKSYQVPSWYQDAKFGIFIHWGVYSVPAFNSEWYPRNMYLKGSEVYQHHRSAYGNQSTAGYKDFIPLFTAKKWDPKEWAALFRESGAKYVIPVAEHHDGFALYDTKFSRWNAVKMGPKRDIIGDLATAVREEGLAFGLSTHRAEHWWFFNGGKQFKSDVQDARFADFYGPAMPDTMQPDRAYLEDWLARDKELVDKYRPQVVWFDWWIEQPAFAPYLRKFAAHYYNSALKWKRGAVINYKNQAFPDGTAVFDVERGKAGSILKMTWQTDTSIGKKSWGYIEGEEFKTPETVVQNLADIVSKNGNLLLNIGPRADGTIPDEVQSSLRGIGRWLRMNGEAIYGTRPWVQFGEGPTRMGEGSFSDNETVQFTTGDYRFTRKGDCVYAIALAIPRGESVIAAFGKSIAGTMDVLDVSMLGSDEKLGWVRTERGLVVTPPKEIPCEFCPVYRIRLRPGAVVLGSLGVTPTGEQTIDVQASVLNTGVAEFIQPVSLLVDGVSVATKTVTVASGSAEDVLFHYSHPKIETPAISVGMVGGSTGSVETSFPMILMSGPWKFHRGDNAEWKNAACDETSWETVTLPQPWEKSSGYTTDNAYGWYRRTITIPEAWKGHALALPLGGIDDVDETYVNGVRVGGNGTFPPSYASAWSVKRKYVIPPDLIHFGEPNTIAIRVFDSEGDGGVVTGPMGAVETVQDDTVLVFSFFRDNGQDGVFLAWSDDGVHFAPANGDRPVMKPGPWEGERLTRDPSVVYHDGKFHMTWTSNWDGRCFGYAESPDLKEWSEPMKVRPFPDSLPADQQPRNVWAPEITWDPAKGDYAIFWSSTIGEARGHRLFVSRTTDGKTFSDARPFFDQGFSCIDGMMALDKAAARWVMVLKNEHEVDEGGKNLRMTSAPLDMSSPWARVSAPIAGPGSSLRPDEKAEGPALVRWKGEWLLYWDAFSNGHYSMASSKDLEHWTDRTDELTLPPHPRHGTVFAAPRSAVAWFRR